MEKRDHYFTSAPHSPLQLKSIRSIIKNREFQFITASGVFSANKVDTGTSVLLKRATIPPKERILDMGCGIGVVGVVLGVIQPKLEIHFVDINSRATYLAELNAKKHKLKRFTVFTGDYSQILPENNILYDGIYYNPPIRIGKKIYLNHILQTLSYLSPNGVMDIVIKKKLGAESVYNALRQNLEDSNRTIQILGKNSGYWVFEIQNHIP